MRWLIFGLALVIAAVLFQLFPRYEVLPVGAPEGVFQMDKWTGAIRFCSANSCMQWIGGTGPLS
jgi:hypothetical protein